MYESAQKVNQVENVHPSEDSQQHFLKKTNKPKTSVHCPEHLKYSVDLKF